MRNGALILTWKTIKSKKKSKRNIRLSKATPSRGGFFCCKKNSDRKIRILLIDYICLNWHNFFYPFGDILTRAAWDNLGCAMHKVGHLGKCQNFLAATKRLNGYFHIFQFYFRRVCL